MDLFHEFFNPLCTWSNITPSPLWVASFDINWTVISSLSQVEKYNCIPWNVVKITSSGSSCSENIFHARLIVSKSATIMERWCIILRCCPRCGWRRRGTACRGSRSLFRRGAGRSSSRRSCAASRSPRTSPAAGRVAGWRIMPHYHSRSKL